MLVKIINGNYGHYDNGIVSLKTPDSKPFELEDSKAKRIIGLGVAVKVDSSDEEPAGELTEESADETADDEEVSIKGHLDAEQLTEYSKEELKNLAKDLGVSTSGSKEQLIDRIIAVEVEAPVADEEPPILEAVVPEV